MKIPAMLKTILIGTLLTASSLALAETTVNTSTNTSVGASSSASTTTNVNASTRAKSTTKTYNKAKTGKVCPPASTSTNTSITTQ